MTAESSVHPIQGEAEGVEGLVEIDVEEGRLAGAPSRMEIQLPVSALESGNALQDREMRRRIDVKKFPRIEGRSTDIRGSGDSSTFTVTGEVTFHGRTNTEENTVALSLEDGLLRIRGRHTFDIRDYGVDPPKILMLRVHPEVTVEIDLRATART